uniref:Painless n=1 Tax=Agasicles hygrophila TaxID=715812 RepID=A0A7D5M117_9CUCU|nr:painless [Agasicles hygrophila]
MDTFKSTKYSKMDGPQSGAVVRTNSICPSPEDTLLQQVLQNDIDGIAKTINDNLINHIYEDYNKPILLIACMKNEVNEKTIAKILEYKPNLRYFDKEQWEALHYASSKTDSQVLKLVIDSIQKKYDINKILAQGNNALHILIKYGNLESDDFIKCAEILIQAGINVNLGDNKNYSPILLAAFKGLKPLVELIINNIQQVDLDSHTILGKSARDYIREKVLYNGTLPRKLNNNNQDHLLLVNGNTEREIDILFTYIKKRDENGFVNFKNGNIENLLTCKGYDNTLLQLACDVGTTKIVQHLIDNKADRLETTAKNKKTPIEIAADHGFFTIFKILLVDYNHILPTSVLINLIRYYNYETFEDIDRKKCCNHLLDEIDKKKVDIDINGYDDFDKNTPLHFAVRYADADIIERLLKNGASLGSKNVCNIMPIRDIEPDLLEKHLDDCVQFNLKAKKEREEFEIDFDYRTLMAPYPVVEKKSADEESGKKQYQKQKMVHETEVISYMSGAPEFKHLMMHPVIASFLNMKWHRIQGLYFLNLGCYFAYCLFLVSYIFAYYANFDPVDSSQFSGFYNFLRYTSWVGLLITFIIIMFREIFQICIIPSKYFTQFENYVEFSLIILSGCILFIKSPSVQTRKQLSSVSILFAAFELVLMLGQHPKFSTNVVMLRTVSYNFFKFFSWYCLLLIAFALSFHILFSEVPSVSASNGTDNVEEDDNFGNAGKSVFKTIIMLTGEFDASDLNFKPFPVVSKIIFVLFIFMIAIILLNLLNGLAVSDTQMIKNDAEQIGHIYRAQHIYYVELMILGNVIPKYILKKINQLCCCLNINKDKYYSLFKPFTNKVCLFNSPECKITMYPNRNGKLCISGDRKQSSCCSGWCNSHVEKAIIRRTNEIVKARQNDKAEIEVNIKLLEKILKQLNSSVKKSMD